MIDRTICPVCGSDNVCSEDSDCLCHCSPSCWSYPICKDCGYTAGGSGANSDGGIWISFNRLNADDEYIIEIEKPKAGYVFPLDCVLNKTHFTSCDDGGYCKFCGYKLNTEEILEDAN